MTGAASDPPDWQPHIRNKARREVLAKRFRDPDDPLRVVLVRDMRQRNLAVELLQKLLKGELATRRRRNVWRPGRSPRCWSRPFAATRTAPSKPRR